jgi:sugar lactone lactonase YvrE
MTAAPRSAVYDPRPCHLGEGPLWHPGRGQLFWFDILGKRLLTREGESPRHWDFAECVSAAGWTGQDTLLVASETGLAQLDLATGATDRLVPLDAEDPGTRSNDGRADPFGGFWIGTMGKKAERGRGAIWRYHRGEVRRLYAPITIPNAIAFAPDGLTATFADTPTRKVMRVRLGRDGWPAGEPQVYLDLGPEGLNPDGAVFDAAGNLWLAEWGAARVACYGPDGLRRRTVGFAALNTSCPAFGGPGLTTLFCTTAAEHLTPAEIAAWPLTGQTFAAADTAKGQPEHRVLL